MPDAHVETLAPYHLLQSNQQVEDWLNSCDSADVVLACRSKLVFATWILWALRSLSSVWGRTVAHFPGNPHGDYHDFLAMAFARSRIPWGRIQRLRLQLAVSIQGSAIINMATASTHNLSHRITERRSILDCERIPLSFLCGYTKGHPRDFRPIEGEPFVTSTVLPVMVFVVNS